MKNVVHPKPGTTEDQARSLYAVRRTIGLLGFSLPPLFFLYWLFFVRPEHMPMPPSISAFYHTPMGDVLVGGLCAVGLFLVSYLGYTPSTGQSRIINDFWVSTLAGVGALGVALLPTGAPSLQCDPGAFYKGTGLDPTVILCANQGFWGHPEWLHFVCAAGLFVAMAVMCIFLFPKDETGHHFQTGEHRFYRYCGAVLVFAALGLLFVTFFVADDKKGTWVFWLEALGVMVFSVAWMVKGRTVRGVRTMIASVRQS